MLVATNRCLYADKLSDGVGPVEAFGEEREKSENKLRFARATRESAESWRIQLLRDGQESSALSLATRAKQRSCVLYVHGHNKTFKDSLEQASTIENRYHVDVILFSWPSFKEHPQGNTEQEKKIGAYLSARTIAESPAGEFDRFLQLCSGMPRSPASASSHTVNLFCHSMGNYLLQNYVESQAFEGFESKGLSNVVVCQADVNCTDHQLWLRKLIDTGPAVHVTVNQRDNRLALAQNVLNSTRLGNTRPGAASPGITYVDVTDGRSIGSEHTIWSEEVDNDAVRAFFASVLNGEPGGEPFGNCWGSIRQLFPD